MGTQQGGRSPGPGGTGAAHRGATPRRRSRPPARRAPARWRTGCGAGGRPCPGAASPFQPGTASRAAPRLARRGRRPGRATEGPGGGGGGRGGGGSGPGPAMAAPAALWWSGGGGAGGGAHRPRNPSSPSTSAGAQALAPPTCSPGGRSTGAGRTVLSRAPGGGPRQCCVGTDAVPPPCRSTWLTLARGVRHPRNPGIVPVCTPAYVPVSTAWASSTPA